METQPLPLMSLDHSVSDCFNSMKSFTLLQYLLTLSRYLGWNSWCTIQSKHMRKCNSTFFHQIETAQPMDCDPCADSLNRAAREATQHTHLHYIFIIFYGIRLNHEWGKARDRLPDLCAVCNDAVAVLICHGEERAEPKGEAPIYWLNYVPTLTPGQELWVMTERTQHKQLKWVSSVGCLGWGTLRIRGRSSGWGAEAHLGSGGGAQCEELGHP